MSEHLHDDDDFEDDDHDDVNVADDDDDFDDDDDVNVADDDDRDDRDDGPEGNRIVGASALQVLEYVTKSIVDDQEGVFVDTEDNRGTVTFHVHVAPDDMGRVIGKRGRVAQAIRAVVAAAGHREGVKTEVEFED